ncbi:trans-aconitate 2-methyltransferase [Arthrobacter zhaoguopingii]|uniref:trans-aconitate 2-methyltransferase n=1 Tax=Arthrobacter zhaoguopingii TaxID=2681491 RepID=UPI00135A1AF1|nr:trans-aconitate 2-methyltransferase [Arthrobacter zhaoguopingii]
MRWDPRKYAEFADQRGRPFFDLVSRIGHPGPRRVVDLGCGPGDLTAALARRWPAAEVVGIDSSPEMIARARDVGGRPANLTFTTGDAGTWLPGQEDDVIVSNALLQWVPGHRELLRKWAAAMGSGAWLAFQVPGNFDAPSHALMRRHANSPRWDSALRGVLRHADAVDEPGGYLRLLAGEGLQVDAWETVYHQVLQGEDPVLEWVRGTGLRPVLAALPEAEAAEFEEGYARLLRQAYPAESFGTVFPFRRIFAVAVKPPAAAGATGRP